MRVLVQRVLRASVSVEAVVRGEVGAGLLLLVGLRHDDGADDFEWAARKVVNLRVFNDARGVMNRSVVDAGGGILAVSQFTLDAQPLLPRLSTLHDEAPGTAARVGIAGPTNPKTLWKYALYCGIGNSLKALGTHGDTFAQLGRNSHPEVLLGQFAMALELASGPTAPVEGIHIFTFGGVAKSVAWANQLVAEAHRA